MSSESDSLSKDNLIRTIRISSDEVRTILEDLDDAVDQADAEKREHPRRNYRLNAVIIKLRQPGDYNMIPHLVPTRNISEGGLSFLHGGYVHEKTRCQVVLKRTDGKWVGIPATVVRCGFVKGKIHEIGVAFDKKIDMAEYIIESEEGELSSADDREA